MAKRRTTPELNLQKELPQVLSTDFNLFYEPEAEPIDPTVAVFTKSLDNFISGAGTDLVIQKETKIKEKNEAQAIKDYNENRDKFAKQVEQGNIPKESNPYYIEKLQELHLNRKAEEFKINAYRRYGELKVGENTNVGAFEDFYKDELKNFVASNQLGTFSAEKLDKGFFSKTSGTRNSLSQTHAQNQLTKVGELFDLRTKENFQSVFADDTLTIEQKGEKLTLTIQEIVKSGGGKLSTRNLFLEALKEYANTTSDFEGASRLVRELPKNINLSGLGSLGDVNALKNDFDEIKELLDDREDEELRENNQKATDLRTQESNIVYKSLDTFKTIGEFRQSDTYKNLSAFGKKNAEKIYSNHQAGYSEKTNEQSLAEVQELIKKGQYDSALFYLEDNQNQFKETKFNELLNTVEINKATKRDGLLEHKLLNGFTSSLESTIKTITSTQSVKTIDAGLVLQFETDAKQWLASNPLGEKYTTFEERETAFLQHMSKKYNEYLDYVNKQTARVVPTSLTNNNTGNNNTGANTEKFDETKLNKNKKRTKRQTIEPKPDEELSIDLEKVVIIPENLSGTQLRKFRRDNPNAITQEEFDRIKLKQQENKIEEND